MKSCEVFDKDNEIITELARKRHTSKKWIIHNLLWLVARKELYTELTIKDEKVVIK